jgi:hypothetical protein
MRLDTCRAARLFENVSIWFWLLELWAARQSVANQNSVKQTCNVGSTHFPELQVCSSVCDYDEPFVGVRPEVREQGRHVGRQLELTLDNGQPKMPQKSRQRRLMVFADDVVD